MITISLCMIVKNEEETLARCLYSVQRVADEIIILDTGSTDRTKEIARAYTDKVYDFEWIDDFSAARNASFQYASKDYILWLDADDIIPPEEEVKLLRLKEVLSGDVDAVMMRYHIAFDDAGAPIFSYSRERLVKRALQFRWREPVHEYLEVSGKIETSDIAIVHAGARRQASDRNLRIYRKQLASGAQLTVRGMYYYARELKDHELYADAVVQFGQFLDSGAGWMEDNIAACRELASCLLALGEPDRALRAMYRSFCYDLPRAETCCQIGYFYKEQAQYARAAFWFEQALRLKAPAESWGFYQKEYWGYIPSIECAVCYDRLGQFELAESFNERAGEFKPDCPAVQANRRYFQAQRQAGRA